MQIKFSPVRVNESLALSVDGDSLKINGADLDLGRVQEGDTLPAEAVDSPWINGNVTRSDGVLSVTIRLPHGPDDDAPARWPEPIEVENGPVTLPSWGESAPEPVLSTGAIVVDWSKLVTAAAAAASSLQLARADATMTLGEFAVAAHEAGYITFEQAEAWAISNTLPPQVEAALGQIESAADMLRAKVALAKPVEPIKRNAARLPFVAQAFGVAQDQIDAALDALFGIA